MPKEDQPASQDPDDSFFSGASNELAPFELPIATFHSEPGQFPWWELDQAGKRLTAFAHRFGSYDWADDPDQPTQAVLLSRLATGKPHDPVEGEDEFLWHCLFAVVRADRFNDGLVARNLLALTRIANELRGRLLAKRGSPPGRAYETRGRYD